MRRRRRGGKRGRGGVEWVRWYHREPSAGFGTSVSIALKSGSLALRCCFFFAMSLLICLCVMKKTSMRENRHWSGGLRNVQVKRRDNTARFCRDHEQIILSMKTCLESQLRDVDDRIFLVIATFTVCVGSFRPSTQTHQIFHRVMANPRFISHKRKSFTVTCSQHAKDLRKKSVRKR